jgi:hypothetical protein
MFLYLPNRFTISTYEPNALAFRMKRRNWVIELRLLSAALIVAAMIATPALARESHVSSRHLAENANTNTAPEAYRFGEGGRFRGQESHDVWGHWGSYYGPMIPSVP